jgi:hypothetical protein
MSVYCGVLNEQGTDPVALSQVSLGRALGSYREVVSSILTPPNIRGVTQMDDDQFQTKEVLGKVLHETIHRVYGGMAGDDVMIVVEQIWPAIEAMKTFPPLPKQADQMTDWMTRVMDWQNQVEPLLVNLFKVEEKANIGG